MKWRQIIYSTPMIQAKLAGRKTQTRRLSGLEEINQNPDDWEWTRMSASHGECQEFLFRHKFYSDSDRFVKCPYGKPGDGLWLRETWAVAGARTRYKADYDWTQEEKDLGETAKWRASIHMPKATCRLFDKIIRIKPERLHEISGWEAIEEGVEVDLFTDHPSGVYYTAFMELWQSLHGVDSWNLNPWVWVIETKSVDRPEGWPF